MWLWGEKKLQIPPLRSPAFPVEFSGFRELHAALSRAAQQEIRVRSGRDDKSYFVQDLMICLADRMTHGDLSLTFVIPTEA
jgi:hypothetical protein